MPFTRSKRSRTAASRRLTQTRAAKRVGLAQSDLSRIVNGMGFGFSVDRLIEALRNLGRVNTAGTGTVTYAGGGTETINNWTVLG